jgi:hypothetical protein
MAVGNDSNFAAGEVWTRVYGALFIYCNNVSNTITNPVQAASALYADAQAQAAAEATAWPYSWFNNSNYAPRPPGRGTVTGTVRHQRQRQSQRLGGEPVGRRRAAAFDHRWRLTIFSNG